MRDADTLLPTSNPSPRTSHCRALGKRCDLLALTFPICKVGITAATLPWGIIRRAPLPSHVKCCYSVSLTAPGRTGDLCTSQDCESQPLSPPRAYRDFIPATSLSRGFLVGAEVGVAVRPTRWPRPPALREVKLAGIQLRLMQLSTLIANLMSCYIGIFLTILLADEHSLPTSRHAHAPNALRDGGPTN